MQRNSSSLSHSSSVTTDFAAASLTDVTDVDSFDVYRKVLQVAIIAHRTEPRYRFPKETKQYSIKNHPSSTNISSPSNRHSFTGLSSSSSSFSLHGLYKAYKNSDEDNDDESNLPEVPLKQLDAILKSVAYKTYHNKSLSEFTNRCLLSFYAQQKNYGEAETKNYSSMIGIYTKIVVSEIGKTNAASGTDVNIIIYRELSPFFTILIESTKNYNQKLLQKFKQNQKLIQKNEYAIKYLKQIQSNMEASSRDIIRQPSNTGNNDENIIVTFEEPSFTVGEMSDAKLISDVFNIDAGSLQKDITELKDDSVEIALEHDLKSMIASNKQNIGIYKPSDFESIEAYKKWEEIEFTAIEKLLSRLNRPTAMSRQELPSQKNGNYYIIPTKTREFFIKFMENCLRYSKYVNSQNSTDILFSNQLNDLINLVAKYWRIGEMTKAVLLFTAANNSIINITNNKGEIVDIDTSEATTILETAAKFLKHEESNDILAWPEPDKREWVNNIQMCYLQTMSSIRNLLANIFSENRPKFNSYILFLCTYIEEDPTYETYISKSGLPVKWKRKLKNTVGRAIDQKYIDIISKIPSDETLNISHVYLASTEIIKTLELIQTRFKQPFLGFLDITKLTVEQFTNGFVKDSKKIIQYIDLKNGSFEDIIDLYKTLCDIRFAYRKVKKEKYPFNLETYFYPYIEKYVKNSREKIETMIINAFKLDLENDFVIIEDDPAKISNSVKNIFRIVNQNIDFVKELEWEDEYQLSKFYTLLLESISRAFTEYGNRCLKIITDDLNRNDDDEEETNNSMAGLSLTGNNNFISGFRNVLNGNSKSEPPKPYEFKTRTCILLNNVGEMVAGLDRIEQTVNAEKISKTIEQIEGININENSTNFFTIKVIRAEDLNFSSSDGSINTSVVFTSSRTTIGKTKKIPDDLFPQWNEEFEFAVNGQSGTQITATVWNTPSSSLKNHKVLGRTNIPLDPANCGIDGMPIYKWLQLDPKGKLYFAMSLETEKADALYCIGRAHRSLVRVQDKAISLMVKKFSEFISYSISRNTLREICGNGSPSSELLRSAIFPLGNYLNSNLAILSRSLTREMLLKVMLECWSIILNTADMLLLPPLNSAKNPDSFKLNNNIWLSRVGWNSNRSLTQTEIEVIFEWLKILCVEFFYANGNGPSLVDLKNKNYQKLLLIPVHYVNDTQGLKEELMSLRKDVNLYIREKNYYLISDSKQQPKLNRSGTIARLKTSKFQGSATGRAKAEKISKEEESDPLTLKSDTEDIILRVLIAKGEIELVGNRIKEREQIALNTQIEMTAKAAGMGYSIF